MPSGAAIQIVSASFSHHVIVPLTWTNAVAISTPVPKCLQMKNVFAGTLTHLTFFARTGKPAPKMDAARTRTGRKCQLLVLHSSRGALSTYTKPQHGGRDRTRRFPGRYHIVAFLP